MQSSRSETHANIKNHHFITLFFIIFLIFCTGKIKNDEDQEAYLKKEKNVILNSSNNKISSIRTNAQIKSQRKTFHQKINKNQIFGPHLFYNRFNPESDTPDFINFHPQNNDYRHLDPKYFAKKRIASNPKLEFNFCLHAKYPRNSCFNLKEAYRLETDVDWPIISNETLFLNNLKNFGTHTSWEHSTVELIDEDSGNIDYLTYKITSKNPQNQPKKYGGDLYNARLISTDNIFFNGTDWERPTSNLQSIIVPGQIIDNLNGTYNVKFPKIFSGKFYLEIILMRNSEAITSLIRGSNGMQKRLTTSRMTLTRNGKNSNKYTALFCGPFLPDLLLEKGAVHSVLNDCNLCFFKIPPKV